MSIRLAKNPLKLRVSLFSRINSSLSFDLIVIFIISLNAFLDILVLEFLVLVIILIIFIIIFMTSFFWISVIINLYIKVWISSLISIIITWYLILRWINVFVVFATNCYIWNLLSHLLFWLLLLSTSPHMIILSILQMHYCCISSLCWFIILIVLLPWPHRSFSRFMKWWWMFNRIDCILLFCPHLSLRLTSSSIIHIWDIFDLLLWAFHSALVILLRLYALKLVILLWEIIIRYFLWMDAFY